MIAEIRDPDFVRVIGAEPKLERLATGFEFTEGPIWHPHDHHLIFSDIPANALLRWTEKTGVETLRHPSHMANGNTWDRSGRMLSCEHATSRVTRTAADGTITVLASHAGDLELNSPNDTVVKSDGRIYFTDPTYGRMPYYGVERPSQLDFQGVWRVNPDGSGLVALARDFVQPNGLCFSADERLMFVNDTEQMHIRVFEVTAQGDLRGGAVWATLTGAGEGGPDGMKIDAAGNLYCCGPGGLHVFAPDARCLGVIGVPEMLANFTWGDADMRGLYLTATTSLYRVRSATAGTPLF